MYFSHGLHFYPDFRFNLGKILGNFAKLYVAKVVTLSAYRVPSTLHSNTALNYCCINGNLDNLLWVPHQKLNSH